MPKTLVISPILPSFSANGNNARLAEMLAHLRRQGHSIHLVVVCRTRRSVGWTSNLSNFVDRRTFIPLMNRPIRDPLARVLNQYARPSRSRLARPYQLLASAIQQRGCAAKELAALVESEGPDVLWVNYAFLAPVLREVPRDARVLRVVDTHDVMHQRKASLARADLHAGIWQHVTRQDEAGMLRGFDVVIGIQPDETRALREMVPDQQVITVGRAMQVEPAPCFRKSVGFVGARSPANWHGLKLFLERAWTHIARRYPQAQLEVMGSVCREPELRRFASRSRSRVQLRGVVRSLSEVYRGPAVMICPLWAGSGLKQKLVESLAYGKACVTTPVGAQGLEETQLPSFEVVKRPEEFVDPVARLLADDDARTELEHRALHYAHERFAPQVIYAELDRTLGETHFTRVALGRTTCRFRPPGGTYKLEQRTQHQR